MEASIIVTYRCNAHCEVCHTWKYPTKLEKEITVKDLEKLPNNLDAINITGGEPLVRKDIEEIVDVLSTKTKKLEISTNGYFTDKLVRIANKHRCISIRVSVGGLPKINDEVMGIKNGFDNALRTILKLKEIGAKNIGFAITVFDKNIKDLFNLFTLSNSMKIELATAVAHNSFYFHKFDNKIMGKELVTEEFKKVIKGFLKSRRIKNWFRAYFNYGLTKFANSEKRLLYCGAGTDIFFLDPYGEVFPCNVMEESMGNIREKSFDEIWNGERAKEVREKVRNCPLNCWMVGTAGPAIKKRIWKPVFWILKNKARLLIGKDILLD